MKITKPMQQKIKHAKTEFHQTLLNEISRNSKNFWKNIKSICLSKKLHLGLSSCLKMSYLLKFSVITLKMQLKSWIENWSDINSWIHIESSLAFNSMNEHTNKLLNKIDFCKVLEVHLRLKLFLGYLKL